MPVGAVGGEAEGSGLLQAAAAAVGSVGEVAGGPGLLLVEPVLLAAAAAERLLSPEQQALGWGELATCMHWL